MPARLLATWWRSLPSSWESCSPGLLGPDTPPALVQFHWPLTVTLLGRMLGVHSMDTLLPHPILIASWVGLFVTSLNLIPAGQLDGGHILYAISSRWHRGLTWVVPIVLLAMGVTLWTGWVLWGVILLLPAMRHPHVPYFPLMPYNFRWLGLLALAILLLTLLPAPFVGTSVIDLFPDRDECSLYIRFTASTSTIRLRRGMPIASACARPARSVRARACRWAAFSKR